VSIRAADAHESPVAPLRAEATATWTFEVVYGAHFPFVWRTVRRLGVIDGAVDDVVQDVFVVVHRRLPTFRGESPIRSWLFAIVRRVVRDTRRSLRRKPAHLGGGARGVEDVDSVVAVDGAGPLECLAKAEALRALHGILDGMPEAQREVFILAELEQMSVAEIGAAVGANVNTVYSRLRAARAEFERAAARIRARDEWRMR
jgi:RNA polymerase sigma-70 factor (ECF subfamily)